MGEVVPAKHVHLAVAPGQDEDLREHIGPRILVHSQPVLVPLQVPVRHKDLTVRARQITTIVNRNIMVELLSVLGLQNSAIESRPTHLPTEAPKE